MTNTLIYFAAKMHFCSKNTNAFENTSATTVNEFVINEFVKLTMLRTTGPRFFAKIASLEIGQKSMYIDATLVLLNKLRCHAHLFSANQITRSGLLQ